MLLIERTIEQYLRLTEQSQLKRTIVYGLTAFIIVFGLDLLWHYVARLSWFGQTLAADIVEAAVLAVIAAYLSRLREERVLRRQRQVQYLNHHVRNALALIKMIEQQLEGKQAIAVHRATTRICAVIEQLSRDEDVSINEAAPGTYTKAA
jgi:membrane protein implicated in regulation of membrane protease activity